MQYDEKTHIPVAARSAGVVVLDTEKRILLVREKLSVKARLWHIPAGSVEVGEPLEKAALRETEEETGLGVELICYLNTYFGRFESGDVIARHVWLAKPTDDRRPSPLFTDEIAECRYFTPGEFARSYEQGRIRMYHTKLMFEEALALAEALDVAQIGSSSRR